MTRAMQVLEREQYVPRPLDEVFAFFAEPTNLEAITPPWLKFKILTPPPIVMQAGARVEYRLRYHGLPLRWRTLIEHYEPGKRFVDLQESGPYAYWRHEHVFREAKGGTKIFDRVEYRLYCGSLGALANALWVRRSVERIFDHRRQAVGARFGGAR